MTGFLVHVGANGICPHAGQLSIVSRNVRVRVTQQAVAILSDTFQIAGCPFNVSGSPQPCTSVRWIAPASRVRVNGQPVILRTSTGQCLSAQQIPQGPITVTATQVRGRGT